MHDEVALNLFIYFSFIYFSIFHSKMPGTQFQWDLDGDITEKQLYITVTSEALA